MKKFILGILIGVLIGGAVLLYVQHKQEEKAISSPQAQTEALNKFRRNQAQAKNEMNAKFQNKIADSAKNFMQSKTPQDMLKALDEIIKLRPQDANLYLLKAQLLHKQGDIKGALAEIDKAISLDPKNPNFYQVKAEIEFDNKDFDNAERDFTIAAQLSGKADNYYNRAVTNLNLGNYQAANRDFKKAQELYIKDGNIPAAKQSKNISDFLAQNMPSKPQVQQTTKNKQSNKKAQSTPQNNDAVNKLITSKMAQSLKHFSESDTLNEFKELFPQADFMKELTPQTNLLPETENQMPSDKDFVTQQDINLPKITKQDLLKGTALESIQKAEGLLAKKDYEGARAVLDKAIDNLPQDDNLYYNRAQANYMQGNYKDAFKDLDKALALNPKNHDAAIRKGDLFSSMGKNEQAKKAYQEAAQIAAEKGNQQGMQEAQTKYQLAEGKEITSKTNQRLTEAANAYYKKDYDTAANIFNQIYQENPTPENAFNLGLAYRGQGKTKEAYEMFSIAAENKPQDFNAQMLSAQSAVELQDFENATKYLDQAKKLDDSNPDMLSLSAGISVNNGDYDSARRELSDALLGYVKIAETTNDPAEKQRAEKQIKEITEYLKQFDNK